ncbi:MAG: CDP-alcohol phosphatidyltransferase family protein [Chloroflexota bacterium]
MALNASSREPLSAGLGAARSSGLTRAEARLRGRATAPQGTWALLATRHISPWVSWATVRFTSLSADAVTVLSIVSGLGAAALVLLANPVAYTFAVLLLQLAYVFDCADGEVARMRGTAGRRGQYLDLIGHVIQNRALYAASSVVLLRFADGAPWALAIAFAGVALASPYGEQSKAQVLGNTIGLPGEHGGGPRGALPAGNSPGARAYRLYRRVAFLWEYPAAMNSFCAAILLDIGWMVMVPAAGSVVLPLFTAGFLGTLALKQTVNAIRLLDRRIWSST